MANDLRRALVVLLDGTGASTEERLNVSVPMMALLSHLSADTSPEKPIGNIDLGMRRKPPTPADADFYSLVHDWEKT